LSAGKIGNGYIDEVCVAFCRYFCLELKATVKNKTKKREREP